MNSHDDQNKKTREEKLPEISDGISLSDDPRVIEALKEYQRALEKGTPLDRQTFLNQNPEIAEALAEGLEALEWMQQAVPQIKPPLTIAQLGSGSELGDYQIIREVGRGGMGVVYEAVQQSLGRHVALKILPSPETNSEKMERFRREARAAAQLHHSNIVPVFGVGEAHGIHYYAMQFIRGESLDEVIRRFRDEQKSPQKKGSGSTSLSLSKRTPDTLPWHGNPPNYARSSDRENPVHSQNPGQSEGQTSGGISLPLSFSQRREYVRWVAKVGIQVAEGLDYAHRQGILHRDIKPANLLLDEQGTVWITDFGLAKLEGPENLTGTGQFVGTLRYLAPERFQGRGDARSDVYSLGLTLYELATRKPAFEDNDHVRLMERINNENPAPPSSFDSSIPRDLETIMLKAIDKEPASRYQTALAFAEDLRRFTEDQPILARRSRWYERTWRWCRRSPALAASLGLLVLALVAVAGISLLFGITKAEDNQRLTKAVNNLDNANKNLDQANNQLKNEKDNLAKLLAELKQTQKDRDLADKNRQEAYKRAAELNLSRGLALCEQGKAGEGLLWMANALSIAPPEARELQYDLRVNLGGWKDHLHKFKSRFSLPGHSNFLNVSRDCRLVITRDPNKNVILWDISRRKIIGKPVATESLPIESKFSPDNRYLWISEASRNNYKNIQLFKTDSFLPVAPPLEHPGQVRAVSFSQDSRLLVTLCENTIYRWNCTTGKLIDKLDSNQGPLEDLTFGSWGKTMLTLSSNKMGLYAQLRDINSGKPLGPVFRYSTSPLKRIMAFAGSVLVCKNGPTDFQVWNARTGTPVNKRLFHSITGLFKVAVSPDSRYILTGAADKVHLWDAETGLQIGSPWPHSLPISHVGFCPNSDIPIAITGSGHREPTQSGSGELAEPKAEIRLWAFPTGELIGMPLTLPAHPNNIGLTLDGKTVYGYFSTPNKAGLHLWEISQKAFRKSKGIVLPHENEVFAVAFSPDGKKIITGSTDKTARVWETATGNPLGKPLPHRGEVWAVAFSPDGKTIATASGLELKGKGGEVIFWDSMTGKMLREPLKHDAPVMKVTFSARGDLILTRDQAGKVQIWDVATGNPVGEPIKQNGFFVDALFSPDGNTILTATTQEAQLWDVPTGNALGKPMRASAKLLGICFDEKGHALIVSADKSIQRWEVPSCKLIHKSPGIAPVDGKFPTDRAVFDPKGKSVLLGGWDNIAQLWDTQTGKPIGPPRWHGNTVGKSAVSSDGKTLLTTVYAYPLARLWDGISGRPLGPALHHLRLFRTVTFSPDGRFVVTTTEDKTARLWEVPSALEGDPEKIALWVKVNTGMELNSNGEIRELDEATIQQYLKKLQSMPGPPVP